MIYHKTPQQSYHTQLYNPNGNQGILFPRLAKRLRLDLNLVKMPKNLKFEQIFLKQIFFYCLLSLDQKTYTALAKRLVLVHKFYSKRTLINEIIN